MTLTPEHIVLHLDMNSYFASVEQQADPFLRGRPVAIAAQLKPYGAIIASSKEAKRLGIRVGLRVSDALAINPTCAIVEVDPPKYWSTTERIFAILAQVSEDIEPYSIDEAFLDLTGHVLTIDEAAVIARRIQQRILSEVGEWLTCSIGLAPTRWLAKFAGDTAPKGELLVLTRDTIDAHIATLKLTDAWGIADRTEARLNALGITTLAELKAASPFRLKRVLGIRGYELWANLNGYETSGLLPQQTPKSVGHQHVLRRRTTDARFHRGVLLKLSERTGRRLRELRLGALRFAVFASCRSGPSVGGHGRVAEPLSDSYELFERAWDLLAPQLHGAVLTSLNVVTFDLKAETGQLQLFSQKERRSRLPPALDAIADRFGDGTVTWGAMWGMDDHAPERVGFRKTVSPARSSFSTLSSSSSGLADE